MANVDRPNGFTPVKTRSGAPVTGMLRHVGVADSADIFRGDAIYLSSGLAVAATAHAQNIVGVAVGFGKKDPSTGKWSGAINPDDQNVTYYDDSANTHTDWCVYYVPVEDVIFEAQFDGVATTPVVGQGYGLTYTAGSAVTGRSLQEVDGDDTTEVDVVMVELPQYVDNDVALLAGRAYFMFDDILFDTPPE